MTLDLQIIIPFKGKKAKSNGEITEDYFLDDGGRKRLQKKGIKGAKTSVTSTANCLFMR